MARHLRKAGHRVTIVATDAYGVLENDDELGVVRVPDLRTWPPLRWALRRGDLVAASGDISDEAPSPAILTKVLVPDAYVVSWLPFAFRALRRLCREDHVDCLVTSSPPESVHLLGLALGRKRPTWIAEFRDGWSFEPMREEFPTGFQRTLDHWLERRVVVTADRAVGVTKPIADDLAERFGVDAGYVPNAWDPESV